jgi:hypothetical protein
MPWYVPGTFKILSGIPIDFYLPGARRLKSLLPPRDMFTTPEFTWLPTWVRMSHMIFMDSKISPPITCIWCGPNFHVCPGFTSTGFKTRRLNVWHPVAVAWDTSQRRQSRYSNRRRSTRHSDDTAYLHATNVSEVRYPCFHLSYRYWTDHRVFDIFGFPCELFEDFDSSRVYVDMVPVVSDNPKRQCGGGGDIILYHNIERSVDNTWAPMNSKHLLWSYPHVQHIRSGRQTYMTGVRASSSRHTHTHSWHPCDMYRSGTMPGLNNTLKYWIVSKNIVGPTV